MILTHTAEYSGFLVLRNILDRLIYEDEYQKVEDGLTDSNIGSRKKRNIRDNIFVLGAVTNDVVNGAAAAIDVCTYDIAKCFDAIWLEEAINDLHDTGLKNDKLTLLYHENENAKVSVKTSNGLSKRVNIEKIEMQGTVWASLKCTAQQDKLGKKAYEEGKPIYTYKGNVSIPPIGYVDDVLTISKCGNDAVVTNAIVNAFTESKKLRYGVDKCKKIHIGKQNIVCPEIKVHEEKMSESESEKYLGDLITSSGKIKPNINARREKGFGIVSEILSILDEVPLGKFKVQIGLIPRQALLLNGILHNSEVWSDLKLSDIKLLEDVDEHLLRSLFKAQSKTSIEFLHLETGTKPIRFVIASRRINYLKNILNKPSNELIRRVYEAQKISYTKGDWIELVRKDFELIDEEFNEELINNMSNFKFKKYVKDKVQKAAFMYLQDKKITHSKIKDIEYKKLELQPYLLCENLANEEINTLFALRSKMVSVKKNFSRQFEYNLLCKLGCNSEDIQEHLLDCMYIIDKLDDKTILAEAEHLDIFGNVSQQCDIVKIYCEILKIRESLLTDS